MSDLIAGFAPLARRDARLLVLGSIPSRRSLDAGEYYAHPRNAFWPIMERLFTCPAGLDYAVRVSRLLVAGIALWDVLQAAERPGSLDSAIVARSAKANDFSAFFRAHPGVRAVFFNGATARSLWDRHVSAAADLRLVTLPSTSPANTGLTFDGKLAAWQVICR